MAFRSKLSRPSKAQVTPLPALRFCYERENCKLRYWSLQSIQDSESNEERNPRVLLDAKVIQASSSLNLDRDKKFSSPSQSLPNLNFGEAEFVQQFRSGAQGILTPKLNSSQKLHRQ